MISLKRVRERSRRVGQFALLPRVLTLGRRALAVPPSEGALLSRQRVQTHSVEQLRSLLMEHGSPVPSGRRA